jgi:SAM-dependent methyltransferase
VKPPYSRGEAVLNPTAFWDEMAPYYDEYVASTRYKFFKPEDEAEFFNELFKGRHLILDLGCGTGRTIRLLGGRGYKFVGIDISKKMLQIARGFKQGSYVLADIRHLPFSDSTFDAVFSLHGGISHLKTFDEKLLAFKEISRTLKLGGLLFIDVRNPCRRDTGETFVVEWPAGKKKIKTLGYALWPKEAREILRKSQFKLEHLLGGYDLKEKYTKGSRRLIIMASKKEGSE